MLSVWYRVWPRVKPQWVLVLLLLIQDRDPGGNLLTGLTNLDLEYGALGIRGDTQALMKPTLNQRQQKWKMFTESLLRTKCSKTLQYYLTHPSTLLFSQG